MVSVSNFLRLTLVFFALSNFKFPQKFGIINLELSFPKNFSNFPPFSNFSKVVAIWILYCFQCKNLKNLLEITNFELNLDFIYLRFWIFNFLNPFFVKIHKNLLEFPFFFVKIHKNMLEFPFFLSKFIKTCQNSLFLSKFIKTCQKSLFFLQNS